MSLTFKKEERLCSFNEINDLLRRGKSFFTDPFRVVFVKMEGDRQDKILISIPKRNFKRAVDRNLLKRRIREAYRKLRPEPDNTTYLNIMFVYTCREILNYDYIERQMSHILNKLH